MEETDNYIAPTTGLSEGDEFGSPDLSGQFIETLCHRCCGRNSNPPPFPFVNLEGSSSSASFTDTCGLNNSIEGETTSIGGSCPYEAETTVNVQVDDCILYKKLIRTDDYSVVGFLQDGDCVYGIPNTGAIRTTTYTLNGTTCSSSTECDGPSCTNGFPSQTRNVTFDFSEKIISSLQMPEYPYFGNDYKTVEERPPLQTGQNFFTSAFHFKSSGGNIESKRKAKLRIEFYPSPSCYLKVWFIKRVRTYVSATSGSSKCNLPNVLVEEVYLKNMQSFIWNGTGNDGICIDDQSVGSFPYNAWENLITEDIVELNPTITTNGTGIDESVRILKYSFLENYEPDDPPNEFPFVGGIDPRCNKNGIPNPACF
jgi:hypothetical protein